MSCRILYISGSLGLGHVTRDRAIAAEMRRICPDVDIAWIAGSPVSEVLTAAGERLVPEQKQYQSEQEVTIAKRLARHGAGVCMHISSTSPRDLADAIITNLGVKVTYPEIPVEGAHLAAKRILERAGISLA